MYQSGAQQSGRPFHGFFFLLPTAKACRSLDILTIFIYAYL